MTMALQYDTARPGRKRKPIEKRAPRMGRDLGTPELAAKRAALAGKGDPTLAASALGVMEARGFLSGEQHRAGVRYANMRRLHMGSDGVAACVLAMEPHGRPLEAEDEERDVKDWARFKAAHEALRRAGALVKSEVDGVAVHDRLPGWWWRLREGKPRPGDERRQAALRDGLDSLAVLFGYKTRR